MYRTLLLLLLLPALAVAQDLVRNGDLETDADGDGAPDGWAFSWQGTLSSDNPDIVAAKQQPAMAYGEARPDGGRRALKVGVKRPQDDGVWTQDGLKAVPDCKVYRLTAWIKTADVDRGSAHVALVFLGAKNKWLGADYNAILVTRDTDWKRYVAYVGAPRGTQTMRLRLWTNFRRIGAITAWYDDISLEATDMEGPPPLIHIDDRDLPPLDAAARQRGFIAWASPLTKLILPATKPSEKDLRRPLRVACIAGGRATTTVAVRALTAGTIRVAVSDLRQVGGDTLPAASVLVRPARNLAKKLWARDSRVLATPRYLLPNATPVELPADTSAWFHLTVQAPEGTAPGVYTGAATVAGAGGSQTLPLTVEVFDVELLEPTDMKFGYYDSAQVYEGDSLLAKWRRQREQGMTTVGYFGNFGGALSREGGQVTVDVAGSSLAEVVAAHQEAGFPGPFFWLMGRDVERFALQAGELQSDAFGEVYLAVVRAILDYGKATGWPELILQPVDEAFEHRPRFETMVRCMSLLRRIDGLRIEADGMNGNPADLEETMPLIDIFALHDGPFYQRGVYDPERWEAFRKAVGAQDGEIWFYNVDISGYRAEMGRFMYSWHPIKTGARGIITWQYQRVVNDPSEEATGFMHEYPQFGDQPGGPSPSWEAFRQGIEEFRLYRTFQALAERASGPAKAAAEPVQAELDRMLARIDYSRWRGGPTQGEFEGEGTDDEGRPYVAGDLKAPTGWTHDDYDRIRELLLRAVAKLQG